MAKAAQRQFLVKVTGVAPYTGIKDYFAKKTGGEVSSDVNKVWDGGSNMPSLVTAPALADDVTITRPFDVDRDAPILKYLRNKVGKFTADITIQATDRDLIPRGSPQVYPKAILINIKEPEHDASSGDAAEMELQFAIGQF